MNARCVCWASSPTPAVVGQTDLLNLRTTCMYYAGYRSGTVNSNTVNSKFHLIRSYCEIFFYHIPNISCLKCTVNSNFHLIRSKTLLTNDFELTVPNLYSVPTSRRFSYLPSGHHGHCWWPKASIMIHAIICHLLHRIPSKTAQCLCTNMALVFTVSLNSY